MSTRFTLLRRQSSNHYQTFPGIVPPASRGRPPLSKLHHCSSPARGTCSGSSSLRSGHDDGNGNSSYPKRQLIILAIISLAEQTALNSISPYLPQMAQSFPEVKEDRVGLYVGIIASSFAAAQFATNVFWGRLSDRIGRKPVILMGTFLTSLCFLAFGFCRTLSQAIAVQALMGAFNANAGVVSTVLGEITDKSNQISAFAWLPIIYGIGAITGPIIGGVLADVSPPQHGPVSRLFANYPYLLPNLVCSLILLVELGLSFFMLEESLAEAQELPPLGQRVKCLFTWLWQFTTSYRPSFIRFGGGRDDLEEDVFVGTLAESCPAMLPERSEEVAYQSMLVPQIIFLMITYALFNLSNIAYNSLYPIFTSAPRPTGRAMSPEEIGLMLSLAGGVGIFFQAFLFSPIQAKLGNVWSYRAAFLGFVISFFAMPLVGMNEVSKGVMLVELGAVLLVKSVSAVGGLTCAMLLITNASPKPSTLGTLNGLAQTLSAGGRAVGPFVSGALFSAGFKLKHGEWLPWGLFGGIALVGFGLSFALTWPGFETDGGEEAEPLLDDETLERGNGRGQNQ